MTSCSEAGFQMFAPLCNTVIRHRWTLD